MKNFLSFSNKLFFDRSNITPNYCYLYLMNPHLITLFIKHLFLSDSSFTVLISWPFEYELHLTYLQNLPIFTFFSWPFVCQLTFLLWWLCSLEVSSAEYTRLFPVYVPGNLSDKDSNHSSTSWPPDKNVLYQIQKPIYSHHFFSLWPSDNILQYQIREPNYNYISFT